MPDQDKKYKIILVDDDRFLLDMYVNKFSSAGHDSEVFFSGGELIDRLKDNSLPKPDVIVLDIVMPGVDGLQVIETIHKENLAPGSIIVMLTNQTGDVDIERAKKWGVHGYIVKATSIPSEVVDMVLKIAKDNGK
jgi:CheY-like chemotaxis protein